MPQDSRPTEQISCQKKSPFPPQTSPSSSRKSTSPPRLPPPNQEIPVKPRVLSKQMGSEVRLLDNGVVLKIANRLQNSEATALYLVEEQTPEVPIPEFINTQFEETTHTRYLWMSYVPGDTLDSKWPTLDQPTKERICKDTWNIITQIRHIRRPPDLEKFWVCSADGSATEDPLLEDLKKPSRPISNDSVLRARIHERYLHFAGQRYAKELPQMLPRSSSSVFTHGDIAPRNIMIDEHQHITGIIDWETAGWYPHYWEYANIMRPACILGDWQEWMNKTASDIYKCDLKGINAARKVLF